MSRKTPTSAEQWWISECKRLSCAACYRLGLDGRGEEFHHILESGRRVGHACGFQLCHAHHQLTNGGRGPKAFGVLFKFTELDLLNDTIGRVVDQVRLRGRA